MDAKISSMESKLESLRDEYEGRVGKLEGRVESKNRFDEIFVRVIHFQNGWRMGYDSSSWMGILPIEGNGSAGYWMNHTTDCKYL